MPGKMNPVIPEMVIQVAARVMGAHTTITIAAQNGPLQINIMQPLIASETLECMSLLTHACKRLADSCVSGIRANASRAGSHLEQSLALVTPLALKIG